MGEGGGREGGSGEESRRERGMQIWKVKLSHMVEQMFREDKTA